MITKDETYDQRCTESAKTRAAPRPTYQELADYIKQLGNEVIFPGAVSCDRFNDIINRINNGV